MAARFWVGGTGTWDNSATTNWSTTSGGAGGSAAPTSSDAVTFDGNSGASAVITVNANVTAASVALGTTGGAFSGTLDFATNNNSPTFGTFAFSGSGTRTLNLGSGTFTINATTGTVWDIGTTTGLTFDAGTSTVLLSATPTGLRTFSGGARTYYNVTFSAAAWSGFGIRCDPVGAAFHATNLTITNVGGIQLAGASHAISGTLSTNSSSTNQTAFFTAGTQATLTLTSSQTLSWVYLRQITAATSSLSATNSFDGGANVLNGGSITSPSSGGGARVIGG